MEGHIPNQQGVIQTTSYIFQVMQLTRNIPEDDKQYISGVTSQRNIGELYGQLHNTSQNHGGIGRKNNQIFEDSRKTQPVF